MGKPGKLDTFQVYYQCRLAELKAEQPRATTPQECFRRRTHPGALQPLSRPSSSEGTLRSGVRSGTTGSQLGQFRKTQSQLAVGSGMSRQQIASNESLKLAWTKTPSRASMVPAVPTRTGRGREHCMRLDTKRGPDPRRSSLEKPSTDNEAADLAPDEAPTEEQERALALLQRSNFFKSLEPAVLSELPRLATFIEAPKGAVVFRQGDPPSNCWLIAKGEVGFYTSHSQGQSPRLPLTPGCENVMVPLPWEEKARVRTLDGASTFSLQSNLGKCVNKGRSGSVFGELALMDESLRKASAKCHTNCEFMTLPAAAFKIAKERLLQFRAAKKRFLDKYVPAMKDCPEGGPNAPPHPSFFFNKLRVHQEYFFLKQGERDSRALYVIYKGYVELRREKESGSQVCQKLLPGSMFGSWIQHAVEPLSAVAATPCEVWYLKASDMRELPEQLLKTIQHHLSIEYSKLLKAVYVERPFGWDKPVQVYPSTDVNEEDPAEWSKQVLKEVHDQEMRTQFFAASMGHDLINRQWR